MAFDKNWYGGKIQKRAYDDISIIFIRTNFTDTCWLWTGKVTKCGYAIHEFKKKWKLVHRHLYQIYFGPIEKGKNCCHTCDVRNCINPNHIFLGTSRENINDMMKKSRQAFGERVGTSKLKKEDIIKIRNDFDSKTKNVQIAKIFNVHPGTIGRIRSGKTWVEKESV